MEKATQGQAADKVAARPSSAPALVPRFTANPMLRLQQTIGNQAVLRMFNHDRRTESATNATVQGHHCKPDSQAAWGAGATNPPSSATVRRSCACGSSGSGTGKCAHCREEELLRRSSTNCSNASGLAPQVVHDALRSLGQPLEHNSRAFMESRLGRDFRHIRVSSDDTSAAAADAIQAKAFTYGNRIVFGRNEYAPNSPSGLRLIAHELAHTAQQGSSAPSLETSLRIGGLDDPQEREADQAADAVLGAAQAPSLSSGGAAVRRAPKDGYTWDWKGVNEGVYQAAGGAKYTVIRSFKPVTTSEETTIKPGARFAMAFVTIKWCKHGVRGTLEAGVDANRLLQLIPQILATGDPVQVLQRANLTAYVDTVILPSEKGPVHFNIQADVGRQGVSAVRVGGEVETSIGRVGGNIGAEDLGPGGQPFFSVGVRITPGKKAQSVQCETTTFKPIYECRKEENVGPFDLPLKFTLHTRDRTRYLYFDYARAKVTATDTRYGKDHPEIVARNEATYAEIRKDLQEEFRISAIEGFTSPEGPLHREGKVTGEFKDNQDLSERRAEAALNFLAESGFCALRKDEACFTPSKAAIEPKGQGELFTAKDERGKELEGKKLAEFAIPEFKKEEGSQLTEGERKTLASKRGVLAEAEVVYPLLRRAKITLQHQPVPKQIKLHLEGGATTTTVDCPRDVLEAAKAQFRLRDAGIGIGGL